MKGKLIVAALALLGASFAVVGVVSATTADLPQFNTNITRNQTIDSSLYAADESVTIAGTINGDVFCAGTNINVTGTVNGDVICAGQNVRLSGDVTGDVRAAGQTITLGGQVGGSVTTFGQTINIDPSATVARDLSGAGQTVNVSGEIMRDVLIGAQTMDVTGMVGRNIVGGYENLNVSSGAKVGGMVDYTSSKDADIAKGSVAGSVTRTDAPESDNSGFSGWSLVVGGLFAAAAALLMALVLALIFPRQIHAVSDMGKKKFFASFAVGFLVVFGTPMLVVLLALTAVGIPIAVLVFVAWLLVVMLSGPLLGYLIGRLVLSNRTANPLLFMLVGSLILLVVYAIPIVNLFAVLAALVIGSGMLVLWLSQHYRKPVYKVK